MDGNVITFCTVTIVKKFEMVQNEQGKEFARGRIVWSRKSRKGNTIEKTPEYREVIAFQGAARALCMLDKGDPVQFMAKEQSKQRTVEKEGKTTVYNDIVFVVYGDVTFLPRGGGKSGKDETQERPSNQTNTSAGELQEGQSPQNECNILTAEEEESIVAALPF